MEIETLRRNALAILLDPTATAADQAGAATVVRLCGENACLQAYLTNLRRIIARQADQLKALGAR